MIALVSSSFGDKNGASQSCLDVWAALNSCMGSIHLITSRRPKVPHSIDGIPLQYGNCTIARDSLLRRALKRFGIRKAQRSREHVPKSVRLCIINSLGNHDFFESVSSACQSIKAIIIRESPGHFRPEISNRSLHWALEALSRYEHCIFVSSICRDEWIAHNWRPNRESFYIPNCCREDTVKSLELNSREHVRKSLGMSPNMTVAACVGSVWQRKGQDLLYENAGALRRSIPNLKIYLVGHTDTQWAKEFKRTVLTSEHRSLFHFVGHTQRALDYIYAADIMLLPSRAEAMPRTILEGMALGTPILSSNVDGIPELIENDHSGMLFDIANPHSLVEIFDRYARDPAKAKQMAETARNRYWAEFSRSRQIERYQKALASILKG